MSNIEFTNNVGAISYTGDLYENNQFTCENGSIELFLEREKYEYGYDMSASFGSITIDEETYENKNVHQDTNGTTLLTISCTMGSINVTFDI